MCQFSISPPPISCILNKHIHIHPSTDHIQRWLQGLRELGSYLQSDGVTIMCGDYTDVFRIVKPLTDVIYADPPYALITGKEYNNYTSTPFTNDDHDRLNKLLDTSLTSFVLSNSQAGLSFQSRFFI